MHLANVRIRFGLILEAFCRGLGPSQLKRVVKQVEAIEKLTKLTDALKEEKDAVRADDNTFATSVQLHTLNFEIFFFFAG